jgi:hypothetical protein
MVPFRGAVFLVRASSSETRGEDVDMIEFILGSSITLVIDDINQKSVYERG